MDCTDCITFANNNPVTYLATCEGDQPRVRAFSMWFADETGFYYHTSTAKAVFSQMKKSPKVELCFYKPGEGAGTMMRVTGRVEFLSDQATRERLFRDRPWVKDILKGAPASAGLAIFRIAHGEASFWTMADNMREPNAPRIQF